MATKTQTAGGMGERGPATLRHAVRELEDVDGVVVVISHSNGSAKLSVESGYVPTVVEIAEKWGLEPEIRTTGGDGSRFYSNGTLAVSVSA